MGANLCLIFMMLFVFKKIILLKYQRIYALRWRHNGRDSVSNHQTHNCLLNSLFRRRSKKTSKLRVTGLCVGNSPGTGEFPAQMASNAENVSIWWHHHAHIYDWFQISNCNHACTFYPCDFARKKSEVILSLLWDNERRGYKVTPSLIGWAQTWNQPWKWLYENPSLEPNINCARVEFAQSAQLDQPKRTTKFDCSPHNH